MNAIQRGGLQIKRDATLTIMSLIATVLFTLHFAADIASSSGAFFWVATLLALGITGLVSAALAARALWTLEGGRSGSPGTRAGL